MYLFERWSESMWKVMNIDEKKNLAYEILLKYLQLRSRMYIILII